eukprot:2323046-Amphidinium_carterae.1
MSLLSKVFEGFQTSSALPFVMLLLLQWHIVLRGASASISISVPRLQTYMLWGNALTKEQNNPVRTSTETRQATTEHESPAGFARSV